MDTKLMKRLIDIKEWVKGVGCIQANSLHAFVLILGTFFASTESV